MSVGNVTPPDIRYEYNVPIVGNVVYIWDMYGEWAPCNKICHGKCALHNLKTQMPNGLSCHKQIISKILRSQISQFLSSEKALNYEHDGKITHRQACPFNIIHCDFER